MPGGGFSDRVIVVSVRKPGAAAREPAEAAIELRSEPVEIIAAELVNGDEDDQRWWRSGRPARRARRLSAGMGPGKKNESEDEGGA